MHVFFFWRGKREPLPHSAWHQAHMQRRLRTPVERHMPPTCTDFPVWGSAVKFCMKLLGVAYNSSGSCAEVLIKCEILLEEMPTHLRLCSGANSSSQLSSQRRSFVAWAHFTAVMHAHEALQSSCIRLLTHIHTHLVPVACLRAVNSVFSLLIRHTL